MSRAPGHRFSRASDLAHEALGMKRSCGQWYQCCTRDTGTVAQPCPRAGAPTSACRTAAPGGPQQQEGCPHRDTQPVTVFWEV